MDKSKLNTYFQQLEVDYLYHFGLDTTMDLPAMFGDLKYVILTRSFGNADTIANDFIKKFYKIDNIKISAKPIGKDERYHLHKVHNTLIVSHGIGNPSLLICINEIVKLIWHARAKDVKFFRVGPAGGLGVEPGSLVIAKEAVNNAFQAEIKNIQFGEEVTCSTTYHPEFTQTVIDFAKICNYSFVVGKIIGGDDFYDGQARLNGAMPLSYTPQQRDDYLQRAYTEGVRSLDMESLGFAGFCANMAIPACEVNAILVNRKNSDMIDLNKAEQTAAFSSAVDLVINHILNYKPNGEA